MTEEFLKKLALEDGRLLLFFAVILSAIVLSRYIFVQRRMQPLFWLSLFAVAFANKVNNPNRSATQQKIAGTMATFFIVLPFMVLLSTFLDLSAYPWFFDIVIMYICLMDISFNQFAKIYPEKLIAQKILVRDRLSEWLAFDCYTLSEIGMAKAIIEKIVIIPSYSLVALMIYYFVGGINLVILVRIIRELARIWTCSNPKYKNFGKTVAFFDTIFQFIPRYLWCLSLSFQGIGSITKIGKYKDLEIGVAAHILKLELGGPKEFASNRIRFDKYIYGPKPKLKDIKRAAKIAKHTEYFWISSLTLMPIIWITIRYINYTY